MNNTRPPFVSVITVVLNAKDSIEQTIERVMAQTYTDFEYIIIDGGSTDGTLDIIKRYVHKIRYISERDKGISDAFNKGISLAHGNLIGLINGDDWYETDALERVVAEYVDSNTVLCGNVRLTYGDGSGKTQKSTTNNIEKSMRIWHPGVFIPKEVYQKVGGYDISYKVVMDYDFVLRCMGHGVNFKMLDRTLSNMRYGGVSNKLIGRAVNESLEIKNNYFPKRKLRNRMEWLFFSLYYRLIITYKDFRFKKWQK